MSHGFKGKFVIVDGLDGIGKGVVLDSIVDYLKLKGLKIFDLHEHWKKHHDHPDFETMDLSDFDIIVSSEPTYVGLGLAIRREATANNKRHYSAKFTADAYSMDRLILYQRVILPALKAGKMVIQSRSVSTSIVYQPLQSTAQGEDALSIANIMALEGNSFALDHAPDLFIIPTIGDLSEIMKRLGGREKDDNCIFENLDFQMKVKPLYESKELKDIFESRGTVVKYLDAGISIESSKQQAVDIFKEILD